MNTAITFGIITDGNLPDNLSRVIDSIRKQGIPHYEIIVVGGHSVGGNDIKWWGFDESLHPAWLTAKKNIITRDAQYPLIVYLHDYLKLSEGWYEGVKNEVVSVGVTRMKTVDGKRYHEWTLDASIPPWWFPGNSSPQRQLPYDCTDMSHLQYISGAYWIASKQVMSENMLNEGMWYPSSEDIEWSHRVREDHKFQLLGGEDCYVQLMKEKHNPFVDADPEVVESFRRIKGSELDQLNYECKEYLKMGRLANCPECDTVVGYSTVRNSEVGLVLLGVYCMNCSTHAGFFGTIREAMQAWYRRTHEQER